MIPFEKLKGLQKITRKKWKACCPAHDDSSPSLQIVRGDKAWLVKCWSGCDIKDICKALEINVSDLWFDGSTPPEKDRFELQRDIVWLYEHQRSNPSNKDTAAYLKAKRELDSE